MLTRVVLLAIVAGLPAWCGDWDPQAAARYLDSRENQWFAWPPAKSMGAPCISCHTTFSYLLARPVLRKALGESAPTEYETGLRDGVRSLIGKVEAPQMFPGKKPPRLEQDFGTQIVLAAFVLAKDDASHGSGLSAEAKQAFDRMWAQQISTGSLKGAWQWTDANLDPWETPESVFYGTALAALAVAATPKDYQSKPEIQENLAAMRVYLQNSQESQPLHNRLLLLWASTKLRILPALQEQMIFDEIYKKQQADGGWSRESLGPWKERPKALPAAGSDNYATAFVSYVLIQCRERSDKAVQKALDWLAKQQNREGGYWAANSMNKQYESGSMQELFMRDATTAYASAALIEGRAMQSKRSD